MKTRTTFRDFSVKLDSDELLAISNRITKIVLEIENIEEEKKKIKLLRNEELYLSRIFNSGAENKSVRCSILYNQPEIGEKTIIRDDLDIVVEVIRMTPEEEQEEFVFPESNKNQKVYKLKDNVQK